MPSALFGAFLNLASSHFIHHRLPNQKWAIVTEAAAPPTAILS
jgi:hypothetical protein